MHIPPAFYRNIRYDILRPPQTAFSVTVPDTISSWFPKKLFFRHYQITVDSSLDLSVPFKDFLHPAQTVKTFLHRKSGKLPFNNTSEPDKCSDIIKQNRTQGFLRLKNLKPCFPVASKLYLDFSPYTKRTVTCISRFHWTSWGKTCCSVLPLAVSVTIPTP